VTSASEHEPDSQEQPLVVLHIIFWIIEIQFDLTGASVVDSVGFWVTGAIVGSSVQTMVGDNVGFMVETVGDVVTVDLVGVKEGLVDKSIIYHTN